MKPDAHSPQDRGNRKLSDARRQLGRAIGALSDRLRGSSSADTSRAAAKSKYRLREVLSTDRSNVGLAEADLPLDFVSELPPSAALNAAPPSEAIDLIDAPPPAAAIDAPPPAAAMVAAPPAAAMVAAPPAAAMVAAHPSPPAAESISQAPLPAWVTTAELLAALAPPAASAPLDVATPAPAPVRSPSPSPAPIRPHPTAAADADASVWDEPIRTRSMARLLASQGHHQRALAIYDLLLTSNGGDASLRAEVDALRGQLMSA